MNEKRILKNTRTFKDALNSVVIIFFLFLVVESVFAANEPADEAIVVTLLNQDPDPAEPGQYVNVRLKIENIGNLPATDFILSFEPKFPFSLDSNEIANKSFAVVGPLMKDDQRIVVKYKVRVSRDAVDGTNIMRFKYMYKDKNGVLKEFAKDFEIDVQSLDPTIAVQTISTNPKIFEPGKKGTIEVTVKNIASSPIRQVSVKLDLMLTSLASYGTSSTLSTSSSKFSSVLDTLPFANMDGPTEQKIAYLKPNEEATFAYNIMVYPSAESRVYKIPLIITFYDEQGNQITKTDLVGIVVGSTPELEVLLDSYDVTMPGTSGRVTIKFVNKGVSEIKFVTVKLMSNDDHKLLSAEQDYVGNIESDDFQTSDFRIYVEPTAKDRIHLPLEISYKDANNNHYEKKVTLYANLYTEKQIKVLGLEKKSHTGYYILGFVLVIVGIVVYRLVKRRKSR
ncbi:MAG: COG1361 S-layer family protein [Candidatus Woesearchaeota archaeon]